MTLNNDKDYWTALKWPAAPNQDDYSVFEGYCTGRIRMLLSQR